VVSRSDNSAREDARPTSIAQSAALNSIPGFDPARLEVLQATTKRFVDEGRCNLDDAVAKYVPEVKEMKVWTGGTQDAPQTEPLKRPVTIKHLLTLWGSGSATPALKIQNASLSKPR
jgi:hypothetical protein